MSTLLRLVVPCLLLPALAAGAEEVSPSLQEFIRERELGEAEDRAFRGAVKGYTGRKVQRELRVFNLEQTAEGFETPDEIVMGMFVGEGKDEVKQMEISSRRKR